MELPVPSPEKQREIVAEYETVVKRIALNEKLGRKLEETAQAIYKHWFVDFEFPMSDEDAKKLGRPELEGKTYQSSGGEMVMCEKLNTAKPVLWGTQSLSQCIDKTSSITYGVVKPGSADPDGVKFVRSGDLLNGRILTDQLRTIESEVSDHYRRTLLSGGEVLLSIVGNPGQVAIVPASLKGANIARQVALLKMRDSDIALFIKSFLLSPIGRDALGVITHKR